MGTIRYNKSDMTIEGTTQVKNQNKLEAMGWIDTPEIGISTGHDTDKLPKDSRLVLENGEIRAATQAETNAYKDNRVADRLATDKRESTEAIEERLIDLAIIRATHKRLRALEEWAKGGPIPVVITGAQFKQSIKDEINEA